MGWPYDRACNFLRRASVALAPTSSNCKECCAYSGMVRRLLLGEDGAQGSICDAMEFLLTTKVA